MTQLYLQQGAQYQGGDYIGADSVGELYRRSVVFMIVGLKQSVPLVVRAVPETTISGEYVHSLQAFGVSRSSD